jgi:hypothetical protein
LAPEIDSLGCDVFSGEQAAAYPDLVPLKVGLQPEQAFQRALDTAKAMPGWSIVAADPTAGRIEARETSLWFHLPMTS